MYLPYFFGNMFWFLQVNGTDAVTKRSASLTGECVRLYYSLYTPSNTYGCTHTHTLLCKHAQMLFVHLSLWLCMCPVEKGIKLVQEGQYSQAVVMFTEAIKYDPKDYR